MVLSLLIIFLSNNFSLFGCMDITAVVLAYNEEKTIGSVLGVVAKVIPRVIVVDDGSTDNTSRIVWELSKTHKHILFLRHKQNKGKSAAVKTALKHVMTPYVLFLDADLVGLRKKHIAQFMESSRNFPLMVVGIRDRFGFLGDFFMRRFPIGGERLVRTDIVNVLAKTDLWKDYNMELLMNWFVGMHSEICFLKLRGLNHTTKPKKWGFFSGGLAFARQFLISMPLCALSLMFNKNSLSRPRAGS